MSFRILGTGSYVPPKVVTNDDLTVFLDTNDEWISSRSGIKSRHVCVKETTSDLATEAAKAALENSHTSIDEIDMILCATVSSEYISPNIACLVQRNLGAGARCRALDINGACTAWIYLMDTAASFFSRGGIRKMLVIGAESMSRILNWHERSTCVLFGDGAGAVVLEPGENYLGASFETRGGDDVIAIPTKKGISPWYDRSELEPLIHMNGQETYKFAVSNFPKRLEEATANAGLTEADIDWVIPHQANMRIIEGAARRMKNLPADHFCVNIQTHGNTSSASIPIAMDEWNRAGKYQRGDVLAMVAFGGGLSSAACLIRW